MNGARTVAAPPARAVVLTIGDELLLGRTVDSNRSWLSAALGRAGLEVVGGVTVGDDERAIREAVRDGLARAELVMTTGGLGPTEDDLTAPSVARAVDADLRVSPEWLAELERRFQARGFDQLPRRNLTQAQVPHPGEWFPNRLGTAPALVFLTGTGRRVVSLPGVPREMRALFAEEILPRLESWFDGRLAPVQERLVRTTGISESVLAERVGEISGSWPGTVSLAWLPGIGGVDLRLTTRGGGAEGAAQLAAAVDALTSLLGPAVYSLDRRDLEEVVLDALGARGSTLAVAESCTGGMIGERITAIPGASRVFLGGVVAYSNDVKADLLGVPAELILRHGAVSGEVCEEMAMGVRTRLGARAALAVTGVAGPEGGTDEKPVGTVWYTAMHGDDVLTRVQRFSGDREAVRHRASSAALALLLGLLEADGSTPL